MYQFILKIAETSLTQNSIWISDGFDANAIRRATFPDYKKNREGKTGEDVFTFLKFTKELLQHTNAIHIEVPGYEADDIIAAIAPQVAPCHIHSTDADLYALRVHEGVTIDRETWKCPPQQVALYKAIVGDPSDNIPGVPGVGEKAFTKMIETGIIPDKVKDNEALILKFLSITNFIAPPQKEIDKWMKKGVYDLVVLKTKLEGSGMMGEPFNV